MMLNKVSLNTIGLNRIGLNRIGKPSRASSDRPYIDPEVLASLKAVCICYGKSNDDPDRAVVKNLVDPDNPFVISNAAFKLNSGYGKYEEDFTSWDRIDDSTAEISNDGSKIKCINTILNVQYLFNSINKDIPSFKVKISNFTKGNIAYYYRKEDGTEAFLRIEPSPLDKVLELPKSYNTVEGGTGSMGGFYSSNINIGVTIEQIPSFEGAFVTDGIDDLIKSTKSATEMLDGSNEVTVVSMIHQIKTNSDVTRNNWFFTPVSYLENRVVENKTGKTGIYGYTSTNVTNAQISDITPILGDKNDYTLYSKIEDGDRDYFTVEGFQNQGIWYVSSVAWYWTIIANKVLTTDQINQVIAYFNLDRCVEPTVWYDVQKQGLSNDTPDSDWYLKDYSGNGYDMTLYNYAKTPESGINEDGGLQSDGVNDFGKVTGMPVYKDYTVVADYERLKINIGVDSDSPILSKSESVKLGAFIFNTISIDGDKVSYSFGCRNIINTDDTIRKIFYQSKYINDGQDINIESTFVDSDKLWLGAYRDSDHRFIAAAIYSLMSFPYSMSEFLIERQLKKHKLGTLYPNMVEFRPVIKHDDRITVIKYYHIKGSSWINLKPGDYIPVGSKISITTNLKSPYTVANVVSSSLTDIKVVPSAGGGNAYNTLGYVTDKSPQKITIDIQVDSSLVQWNPVVESTAEYSDIAYLNYSHNLDTINVGDYISIGDIVAIRVILDNTVDEFVNCKVNGQECEIVNVSPRVFDCKFTLTSESPQKINITIDEYIRFEDIVQPYPLFFEFTDENGNLISWGGKAKVGNTITRSKSVSNANILAGLYNTSNYKLNGKPLEGNSYVVEKQMVFTCTATYLFDNNEPKCILSPSRLRIPNSSYKILGYIPDISGHGNHGKINNSAYAGMSGANGYTEQTFSNWRYNTAEKRAEFTISNDVKLNIAKVIMARGAILYTLIGDYTTTNSIQRYKVTGVDENHPIVFGNDAPFDALLTVTTDGEYEVDWKTYGKNPCIFTTWTGDCNITIEQIGEYEGAYCLDGVDDFVTIPTATSGKQVFMKVNYGKSDCYLYDQRNNWTQYLGIVSTKDFIAYNYSNQRGKTYIDGILNENITANDLISITHNITVTNNRDDVEQYFPCIGTSFAKNSFAQMSLYDFMLFDNISTDDKIKELNEYVGIEGNTDDLFNGTNI